MRRTKQKAGQRCSLCAVDYGFGRIVIVSALRMMSPENTPSAGLTTSAQPRKPFASCYVPHLFSQFTHYFNPLVKPGSKSLSIV